MIMIEPKEIAGTWIKTRELLFQGTTKHLYLDVKFDGNGNSIIRFTLSINGKEATYEKYDSAISAYNRILNK